jgi:threonine dehydratase
MPISLADITAAALRIRPAVGVTPCPASVALSLVAGCDVYCKLDYLQRTGSFKERGARNALLLLDDRQKKRGVIAASAGNHALALAYHAGLLDIPVTVVMPIHAPLMKVNNCRQLGASIVQHGQTIADAADLAHQLETQHGFTYINGFDHPAIIAGQGTMGLEILEQVPDVDAIIVPIGGGGLVAGIALAVKTVRPKVHIIGVEPQRAASFTAAIEAGKPVRIETRPTLADGLAVPRVGDNAFRIAVDRIDRVVTVTEHAIAMAILRLVELEKSVVEGAGAAGLAALLDGKLPELKGKKVVLPLCGGNIDTPVLGQIIDRGLVADGRLCRFETTISDRPGGLARFAATLAECGASVRDIAHDRAFAGDDLNEVKVRCLVETRDAEHAKSLQARLKEEGYVLRFE